MKRFFLILLLLPALFASAGETTWEAIPAVHRVEASRPTMTTRANVYDTNDLGGPSVTWGNTAVRNTVVAPRVREDSQILLVSGVAPSSRSLDDDLNAFNTGDAMPVNAAPVNVAPVASLLPQQHIAPAPPNSAGQIQQPTSFHRWELDANDNGVVETQRTQPQPRTVQPLATPTTQPSASPTFEVPAVDMQQNMRYGTFLPNTMPCGVVLIQADFPIREIESVAREIAMLQEDLLHYLAVPAPREKIDLCIFASSQSYVKFLKSLFPNAPTDRPALFIKRPGEPATLLVQRDANFEIDLRHEMTHAILHARIDNVPMWLDEGLAKYLELPREQRPYNNPYLKTVKWQSNLWMTSSMSRLETLKFVDDMGTKEYRDSWAWIHFLIHHSPETHQFLASYLQMLATASDAKRTRVPPMSRELAQVLDNPKSDMRVHFSRWPSSDVPDTSSANNTESSEGSLISFFSKRDKSESKPPSKVATTEDAPKKWYQLW
ncbi:MAG: hypothetical protein ACRC46_08495 [Thermoguttaceae bacterium]